MQPRPNITTLPALTNPTIGQTLFVVQDHNIFQSITTPQAQTLLTQGYISIASLKSIVAASGSFTDFQSRIAAL